jgi:hypothetical protein
MKKLLNYFSDISSELYYLSFLFLAVGYKEIGLNFSNELDYAFLFINAYSAGLVYVINGCLKIWLLELLFFK